MDRLHLLVVGGGKVAAEKLGFLYKCSPNAQVTIVALELSHAVKDIATKIQARIIIKDFAEADVAGFDLVIAATDNKNLNKAVWTAAKANRTLINVADTPQLCDFYLGGIVTKGNLKIAISTNGKSPTLAKRLREMLETALPDEVDDLINNLNAYRDSLKGDFEAKVRAMNDLTRGLVEKRE